MDIFSRLSPTYWWTDPVESIGGPLVIGASVALAVLVVLGTFAWLAAPRLVPRHRLHRRLVERAGKAVLGVGASGLLLVLFRWQLVAFFSKRLWLFVWVLACAGLVAYAAYYARRGYPDDLARWEGDERRRRYLPRPATGSGRSRRRGRRR